MASQEVSYNDKIKINDEYTVDGYIRKIESKILSTNSSFYSNIPHVINYVCMQYYHISKDRFDPILHSNQITIIENICGKGDTGLSLRTAFLSNIVTKGYHHWKFKLINSGFILYLGIWKTIHDENKVLDTDITYNYRTGDDRDCAYLLYPQYGRLRGATNNEKDEYCNSCSNGDIIDMYLDLYNNELTFAINDKNYNKAFDIDNTYQYRAVINASGTWKVKLLQYKTKKDNTHLLFNYRTP
eukprot:434588_1